MLDAREDLDGLETARVEQLGRGGREERIAIMTQVGRVPKESLRWPLAAHAQPDELLLELDELLLELDDLLLELDELLLELDELPLEPDELAAQLLPAQPLEHVIVPAAVHVPAPSHA